MDTNEFHNLSLTAMRNLPSSITKDLLVASIDNFHKENKSMEIDLYCEKFNAQFQFFTQLMIENERVKNADNLRSIMNKVSVIQTILIFAGK